jgi:pimeloyl-ACP methyl ester carboxylesterase
MTMTVTVNHPLVAIEVAGRPLNIEFAWVGVGVDDADAAEPLLVFLHEGLGSLAMWKDFPAQLCAAAGCRGLVYSRPGYGQSTPRPADEHWGLDFLHVQAEQVLPALLQALNVHGRYALLGHSDGGSIALIHAAKFPDRVSAAIVMAPHILVEEFGLKSIRDAREQYLNGRLRAGLARYHADVDSAFWGWNDIWLSPDFPQWRITAELRDIQCPALAIQGVDDPYGTMAQIDGIADALPDTQLLKLTHCGHSPHRDQPDRVISAVQAFCTRLAPQETSSP